MTADQVLLKGELRARLRARLAEIPASRREAVSAQARALLSRQPVWRQAGAVLFYAALPDEIDLLPLLEQGLAEGKQVALPGFVPETRVYAAFLIRDLARDCVPGRFGVLEPERRCPEAPLNKLDLTLVPGVGFDLAGCRLGRGGGYYDRLMEQVSGIRCGVAFDEQMEPLIPVEPHDIRLNCILTPTQWLEISPQRPHLS